MIVALSLDIIRFEKRIVFGARSSKNNKKLQGMDDVQGQVYPSTFSNQMEAIVSLFIVFQIFWGLAGKNV